MMNRGTWVKSGVGLILMATALSGCPAKSTTSTASPAVTGSGGTFTGSDINGVWTGNCTAGSGTITGETYYKDSLAISSGNTFTYNRYVFNNSNCNYGANGLTEWSVVGTFTVGGVVSGSMQSITFTATGATTTPNNTGTAWMNSTSNVNGCGATFVSGVGHSIYSNTCVVNGLYTPSPANNVTENVATFTSGSLSIGRPTEGSPGVYVTQGQSVPTSTSIDFH